MYSFRRVSSNDKDAVLPDKIISLMRSERVRLDLNAAEQYLLS
jgi:hypothetical protein